MAKGDPVELRELQPGERFRRAGVGSDWTVYEVGKRVSGAELTFQVRDTESGETSSVEASALVVRVE